jgi:AcrR family transcriptional regulator
MSHEKIVRAATQLAVKLGYTNMSRQQIADHVGCFPSQISFHVGTMKAVRDAIVQYAVDHALDGGRFRYIDVVAQALAAKHHLALKAPKEVKAAALTELAA